MTPLVNGPSHNASQVLRRAPSPDADGGQGYIWPELHPVKVVVARVLRLSDDGTDYGNDNSADFLLGVLQPLR